MEKQQARDETGRTREQECFGREDSILSLCPLDVGTKKKLVVELATHTVNICPEREGFLDPVMSLCICLPGLNGLCLHIRNKLVHALIEHPIVDDTRVDPTELVVIVDRVRELELENVETRTLQV